jgi:hypothetical protein
MAGKITSNDQWSEAWGILYCALGPVAKEC